MKDNQTAHLSNRVPWINLAVGILTLLSPWVSGPSTVSAQWDLTITGALIAIFAIIALMAQDSRGWPIANVLLGIWLLISIAFVGQMPGMPWNNIVLGVVAIVTGLVSQSYESLPTHQALRT